MRSNRKNTCTSAAFTLFTAWHAPTAQADAGQDPARVGSRPNPGFTRRGVVASSPVSLVPCLATQPGSPLTAQAGAELDVVGSLPCCFLPCYGPASLGPCLATPSRPGAPSTTQPVTQACAGPDPTRVHSWFNQGLAWWGCPALYPSSLCPCQVMPLPPGAPLTAQAGSPALG